MATVTLRAYAETLSRDEVIFFCVMSLAAIIIVASGLAIVITTVLNAVAFVFGAGVFAFFVQVGLIVACWDKLKEVCQYMGRRCTSFAVRMTEGYRYIKKALFPVAEPAQA